MLAIIPVSDFCTVFPFVFQPISASFQHERQKPELPRVHGQSLVRESLRASFSRTASDFNIMKTPAPLVSARWAILVFSRSIKLGRGLQGL